MVMDIKNILKILSLSVLFLGCTTAYFDKEKIVYYDWAMVERYDGKPVFSVQKSCEEIEKLKDKNYYKVYYENNIIQKVFTYADNKIVRKDYMDSNGIWLKYTLQDRIECSVKYIHDKNNFFMHVIKCTNGIIYKNKYLNTELIESRKYKNNKLINRLAVNTNQCKKYNQDNKLLRTYECHPYEETRPIEPADFFLAHTTSFVVKHTQKNKK